MRPRSASFIWANWAIVVGRLGYADMTQLVARAFRLGLIERSTMSMDSFKADLQGALDDPTLMTGFSDDHVAPFNDAIGELSTWYGFSDEWREETRRRAEQALFAEPSPRLPSEGDPFRHVGRNEPCPCRSGKKFKKCCLQ